MNHDFLKVVAPKLFVHGVRGSDGFYSVLRKSFRVICVIRVRTKTLPDFKTVMSYEYGRYQIVHKETKRAPEN